MIILWNVSFQLEINVENLDLEVLKSTKTLTEPFGCKIVTGKKENPYTVTNVT